MTWEPPTYATLLDQVLAPAHCEDVEVLVTTADEVVTVAPKEPEDAVTVDAAVKVV